MNSLDDLKVPPVLMGGALSYLCGCHILSFRSGLAGGGDRGIGLSRLCSFFFFDLTVFQPSPSA